MLTISNVIWKKSHLNGTKSLISWTKCNLFPCLFVSKAVLSTTNVFFIFSASMGGQRGHVFYIYYEGIWRTYPQALFAIQKKEDVMSKRKSKPTIVPWLSANFNHHEKRFIQVGNSLVLSHRFQDLGIGTRYLYLCMAMESGGKRDFTFPQKAAEKYGIKPSSLWRHIKELEAGKFIKVYSGKPTREPNKYEFCPQWKRS